MKHTVLALLLALTACGNTDVPTGRACPEGWTYHVADGLVKTSWRDLLPQPGRIHHDRSPLDLRPGEPTMTITSLRNRQRPSINRDNCIARIVVWPPHLDDDGIAGVATCDHPVDHPDLFHEGPIDSHDLATTRISWLETDRRTFRGPLRMCTYSRCCLPHGHRGDHAL